MKFRSTRPLPPPTTSPPNAPPTQLLLSDRAVCDSVQAFGPNGRLLIEGAPGQDGSLRVTYECDGPVSAVFGPINEATTTWAVRARVTVTQGPLRTLFVKRAWR